MLSIGKIAAGQHRYYEQQVARGQDDYYSGRGEVSGRWVGAGASELGLDGAVSAARFDALIAGSDPGDPQLARRLRSSEHDPKVAALDLTFSAPKSVSVLFAVSPENVSGELALAHERAVDAALAYLEDTAVFVRRGHGGVQFERTDGLIAAAYRHRMSRALDPQLHTHVVAANLARGLDGRFSALHHPSLYRAAKTAGYLYQSQLRAEVSQRLGLRWGEVSKGAAELQCVPREVLEEFSKRRHEMLRAAQEGGIGLESKASAESAALATRDRKHYGVETHTWREEVRARAAELGLGAEEVNELLRDGWERVEPVLATRGQAAEQALGDHLVSPEGLTERANTFDERAVLQGFAAAARTGATVEEVRSHSERFAHREDVIQLVDGRMTTAELLDMERRLIDAALGRRGEGVAVVKARDVERTIAAADRPLTHDQAAAVRTTVSTGDGVTVIEALAGTGKTYTAGVLRKVYESAGFQVLGAAPTGRAVRELIEEAGVPARTVDRLLSDLELGDELPPRSVLILDEAGMAATRPSARLLGAAERAGAKVIAIGDPGQLASVQAGGWLATVGRELGAVKLTEVMRQRDPDERRALAALHERLPQNYLDWASRSGRIDTFSYKAPACEQALGEWQRATGAVGPAQAVMIARDNDTRDQLNRGARELRTGLGELGAAHSYGSVEVAVGDRVICRQNDRMVDVDNGMRGTVRHVDGDRVVIDTDSGLVRELPAGYVAEHVEHAYSLTGHGMQGGTIEHAIVVASPNDLSAGWSYTALSRARGETRLLIHDDDRAAKRSEFAPTERRPAADQSDLLARVERRMAERDDEDLAIEQLPSAGRADDRELTGARTLAGELPQERAAALAEPASPAAATTARLRELGERVEEMQAQLKALPSQQLERIEDLDADARERMGRHERYAERLAELPEPRRRFGREHDPASGERANLSGQLQRVEGELNRVLTERSHLARELGDVPEVRAERDGLKHAIAQLTREHAEVRNELAERELHSPGAWVKETFGERPDGLRSGEVWEKGVRQAARYRIEHNITDSSSALGPRPEQNAERHDWERAHNAIDRVGRRLGHDVGVRRDGGLEHPVLSG